MKGLVGLRKRASRDGNSFVYMLDYKDLDGNRRRESLGHANKRKAERARDQKDKELRMCVSGYGSMRLREFIADSFRRTGKQIRQSTRTSYRGVMDQFIELIGNIDVQSVTIKHGERFRQACFDKENTDATVNRKIRAIKRMFQLGVERGQIEENPFRFLKKPRCRKKKVVVFRDEECQTLLLNAKEVTDSQCVNWRLLIAFALETGMRKSELLNLKWEDVSLDNRTIHIPDSKNGSSRTIPISSYAIVVLEVMYQRDGSKVFPTTSSAAFQSWRRLVIRAGIEGLHFHDLRHEAISRFFERGLSIADVALISGHKDVKQLFRCTHLRAEDVALKLR